MVVTGAIEGFSREEAEEAIRAAGDTAAASASKRIDWVIAGPGAGSKLDKAQRLAIPVLGADGLRRLLAGELPGEEPATGTRELGAPGPRRRLTGSCR